MCLLWEFRLVQISNTVLSAKSMLESDGSVVGRVRAYNDSNNTYLRAPSVEEAFHVCVVAVRDELCGRVQRSEDLDAHAVGVVLR